MKTRIISALVAVPLFLFVVIRGGILLKMAVFLSTLIAINEFFNGFKHIEKNPSKKIGIFSTIVMFIITFKSNMTELIMFWFFISMLLILIYKLYKKEFDVFSSMITAMGIFYIVFFMYHIVFIENLVKYHQLIWLVFISAWATDTFAYFTGYFFGSHKLCPEISPKKTVEGAVGGILGSVLVSILFGYYIAPQIIFHCAIIGFLGSIVGQFGDLTASVFKRYVGIKDYGKIMPGHGGILDRFDSILFTAPIVYYYIIFLIQR